ncbi:hypothetical protein BCR32DRAFT_206956, partial [Anaeromyces robustus]
LRNGARDPTFIKSKIASDIHNRLGLPSISANYITLYINDEYMGLYIIMDAYKLSWVEYLYGEKNTTTLINCSKNMNNRLTNSSDNCINENDDFTDLTEWKNFLERLDNAQSASDIEDIFDIDQFLSEIALEYLFGTWDHFPTYGCSHNYYMYKPKNDKWKYLIYDFDADFGQSDILKDDLFKFNDDDYNENSLKKSLSGWLMGSNYNHLIEILIYKDPTRLKNILKNIINEVFNPAILYPHIDEIKNLIKPYIEKEKELNTNGYYPGVMKNDELIYTFHEWDINIEFTTLFDTYGTYGLKYWIIAKYRNVCNLLHLDCDPYYMNDFYFENNLYIDKIKYKKYYECYIKKKSKGDYNDIPVITDENWKKKE